MRGLISGRHRQRKRWQRLRCSCLNVHMTMRGLISGRHRQRKRWQRLRCSCVHDMYVCIM